MSLFNFFFGDDTSRRYDRAMRDKFRNDPSVWGIINEHEDRQSRPHLKTWGTDMRDNPEDRK